RGGQGRQRPRGRCACDWYHAGRDPVDPMQRDGFARPGSTKARIAEKKRTQGIDIRTRLRFRKASENPSRKGPQPGGTFAARLTTTAYQSLQGPDTGQECGGQIAGDDALSRHKRRRRV